MANVKDLLVNGSARVIGTIYGNATSANKLNTNAGSASQPVYFSNGIPVAITGSLSNNAASATKLLNARNFKIGSTSKSFNGTADVTWTHAEIGATVSNTWTGGTTAGPTLKTTVNGVTGTAVAIPSASTSASGIVTTGVQSFAGNKTFANGITLGGNIHMGSAGTPSSYPYIGNKITWDGGTDGAQIYYQIDSADAGRLVLNTTDDTNCLIALAYNGTAKSYINTSTPSFYPSSNNTGSIGLSSNKWASMYATTFYGALSGNATTATGLSSIIANDKLPDRLREYHTSGMTLDSTACGWYYAGSNNTSPFTTASDFMVMNQGYNTSWGSQIATDFRSNRLAVRNKNNGTWNSWVRVLDQNTGVARAHYGTTDGSANYILITINKETYWMLNFTIKLYQSYTATDIQISGYNYGSNHWHSPKAVILGSTTTGGIKVYFGYTGDFKLWVAVDGGTYTGVDVIDAVNGYYQISLDDAFTITRVSALPGTLQSTITAYRPYYRDETVANATTATKLATARTIQTNLASTTAASFDGSANITPGITGTLPISHGGTGQTSIANIQAGKDGDGNTITSKYVSIYNSNNIGQSSSVTVNDLAKQGSAVGMIYAATDNPFGKASWVHVWSQAWNKTVNSSWVSQIALGVDESDGMWYRTKEGTIVGAAWKKVLDSNNYTSYTVTKTGSGASGTWGINISGNAATATNADKLDGYHFSDLENRYVNVTGDTMTGTLNTQIVQPKANATYTLGGASNRWTTLYSTTIDNSGDYIWYGGKNFQLRATANGQEWSFDQASSSTSYTGTYSHFWSSKNGVSIIRFYTDDNQVQIPSTGFMGIGGAGDSNYKLKITGKQYIQSNSSASTTNGLTINNGVLAITNYGQTLTVGALNTSWTHFQTSGSQFYFNKQIHIDGNLTRFHYSSAGYGTISGYNLAGNASTASKLATARTISLAGNLQGSATFDGSANITITALNYQAGINGSNTNNYPWHRIAYVAVGTGQYNDRSSLLRIRHTYNGGGEGLIKISTRTNSTSNGVQVSAIWLYRYNIPANAIGIGEWGVTGDNVYVDVYYKSPGSYPRAIVEMVSNNRLYTLVESNEVANTTTSDKLTSKEVYTSIEVAATQLRGKAYTQIVYSGDGVANDRYVLKSGDTMTGNLTAPSVYTSNWFRSTGKTGWYSETYGGGWYMTDSNFIRNFNSKAVSINIASNNSWGIGTHRLAAVFKGNDHVSILLSTNSLGYGLCVNNDGNWYWGKRTTSSETSTSGDTYLLQGNTTLVKPSTNMAIGLGQVKSSEFSNAYIRAVHARHLDASGVFSSDMNLYIGYGDSSPTQKTLFYYSTGTHGANATSRTQFAEINSNGLYALTRFGVNGQNTSYNLYVNGTSYFNGNTTHNGIDYFANGTTYSINNSADATLRRGLFAGTSNASTAASSFFTTGALEIRESGRVGNAQSSFNFAPRIGFHWGGRIAATLSFHSDGIFYFRKQNGNDRATIDANLNGNAATATKLATARTISLTGSVTGSGTFDGSGNLSITTTTNHNHDSNYVKKSDLGLTTFKVTRSTSMSTATAGYWAAMVNPSSTGSPKCPTTGGWWHIISMDWSGNDINNWISQLAIPTQDQGSGKTNSIYFRHNTGGSSINNASWVRVWREGDAVTGAVWNDYAEYREADTIQGGRCVREVGDDTLALTTKRLMRGCSITSDTWGFAQGETDKAKTPIAVAGRVLAYPLEDRELFKEYIGYSVCSGPDGTVSLMTEEEELKYPWAIIGTVSAVPDYEEWGGGEMADRPSVKVDGRIWIKVK